MWWPGISKEIKAKVKSCQFCQQHQPSQRKEPLITTVLPNRPWQKVFFELAGQKYLVVMNYYSRFIEILSLVKITSLVVIQKPRSVFARWGIPEELVSNNGTQFKSAMFDEFKAEHTTSSPHHHQANGSAESGVRISKRILEQENPFLALKVVQPLSQLQERENGYELLSQRWPKSQSQNFQTMQQSRRLMLKQKGATRSLLTEGMVQESSRHYNQGTG